MRPPTIPEDTAAAKPTHIPGGPPAPWRTPAPSQAPDRNRARCAGLAWLVVSPLLLLLPAFVSPPAASPPPQGPGTVAWRTTVAGEAMACPTIAPDGSIYVATQLNGGALYRIRGADGAILAQAWVPGAVEHSAALGDNGVLYLNTLFQTLDPANPWPPGRWAMAWDAATLTELWRKPLADGADTSPMLGWNDRVYLGLAVRPGTGRQGRFYSFAGVLGDVHIDMQVDGWAACPGVVDEAGRVFFGVEDADGTPTWYGGKPIYPGFFYALTGEDPPPGSGDGPTAWGPFPAAGDFGSPAGYADGVVYTTCRDGMLYGFEAATGTIVLQHDLGAPSWTGVTIGRDSSSGHPILYTGTQEIDIGGPPGSTRRFLAVEVDGSPTGVELWSFPTRFGCTFGNAALDDQGNLYFTDAGGWLYALDAATGSLLWEFHIGPPGSAAGGPALTDDGLVVVTSVAGEVIALHGNGNHLDDTAPWPKYKRNMRATAHVLDPVRDTFLLDVPPLVPGATATVTARGAAPGETVWFVYGLEGIGWQEVAALGTPVDLASPRLAGSAAADPAGDASLTTRVPAAASGLTVTAQALRRGGRSPVVAVTIP